MKNHLIKSMLYPIKVLYNWLFIIIQPIYKSFLSIYCYKTIKVYLCNHFSISIWEFYKKRTKFPHPIGIVIGLKVKMGYDCFIYQNVTIGTKDTINFMTSNYPRIGNNVTIYPNAVIIGDITIGDNSIIGAGAIVLSDVPPNCVAVGNPAKIKHNS